jgi:hypothetical protein
MMLAFFSACQQIDPLIPQNADKSKEQDKDKMALPATWSSVSSQITVVNGRVRFVDDVHFRNYFQVVSTVDEKVVEDFFINLPNFNSLKEKNQREELGDTTSREDVNCRNLRDGSIFCTNLNPPTATEEGAEGISSLVQDEMMYFILNEQGEFAIGSFITRITTTFTYVYASDTTIVFDRNGTNNRILEQTVKSRGKAEDGFVKVSDKLFAFKIQTTIGNDVDKMSLPCGDRNRENELEYRTNRPKRKLKGKIWSQNLGIYSSFGCHSKNLKRRLGIWWQERNEEIRLGWTNVEYETSDPLTGSPLRVRPANQTISEVNNSKIIRRFEIQTGQFGTICTGSSCKPKIKFTKCIKIISANTSHFARQSGAQGTFALTLP